jgi:hypothetical protein
MEKHLDVLHRDDWIGAFLLIPFAPFHSRLVLA